MRFSTLALACLATATVVIAQDVQANGKSDSSPSLHGRQQQQQRQGGQKFGGGGGGQRFGNGGQRFGGRFRGGQGGNNNNNNGQNNGGQNNGGQNNGGQNNGGQNNGGQQGGNNGGQQGGNNGGQQGGNNGGQGNNNGGGGGDAQTSLTLDPKLVQPNQALTGQETPTEGQTASLTSVNNFINFCLTQPNLAVTNGLQNKAGSCNPTPMGVIAAQDKMPACKFQNPKNGATIPENTPFDIELKMKNLQLGVFTNAQATYFGAPATTNAQGVLIGHTHFTIDPLPSLDSTEIPDLLNFAFFKGINTAADANGVVKTTCPGLKAGTYKLSTINSSSNHQPVLVAVAQHGSLDDAVYFTVAAAGNAQQGGNNGQQGGNNAQQGNNNNNGQQNGGQQNGGQQAGQNGGQKGGQNRQGGGQGGKGNGGGRRGRQARRSHI